LPREKRIVQRRIKNVEGVDSGHPVAEALRELLPPDSEMAPGARERMMDHLFFVQRSMPAEKEKVKGKRGARRWRYALVPAAALALAAVVLLIIFFSAGQKSMPQRRFARLAEVDGYVEILHPGGNWRKVEKGEMIEAGCFIRSGRRSYASVAFPEGSVMRLTDGSEAHVKSLGARSVAVQHMEGGTYHRVKKGTRYTVTNEDVSFHALGTAFNVENRVPKKLELVTVENAVEVVVGGHQPITVSQGEVLVVSMTGAKKAEKQPVSKERLEEGRLYASVKQDAKAGNPTGVYQQIGVDVSKEPPAAVEPKTGSYTGLEINLRAVATETGVSLNWEYSGGVEGLTFVLLRSQTSEPTFPEYEIARYSDTSITSARDNNLLQGQTYQYRLAAVRGSDVVAYSNTVVVTVPKPQPKPESASVSLTAGISSSGVLLQWSVAGADKFEGFVVERLVEKAPDGSATPVGSSSVKKIYSNDVFYSYRDDSVVPGHTYSYRVGLLVGNSVMVYSNTVEVEFPAK
jgi:hypothetical protein